MKTKNKIAIALFSFLILWVVEILKNAIEDDFDFAFFFSWFYRGLGSATASGIIGMVVGGFVLFNIFLFFYYLFKPNSKLSFSHIDRIIVGLWLVIIFSLFNPLKVNITRSADTKKDEMEIKSVIYENAKALEDEDLKRYQVTLIAKIPEEIKEKMSYLFINFDLKYEVKEFKILDISEKKAKVRQVLITKKISGLEFNDNKIIGLIILRKSSDGKWRICDSKVLKFEYLK